MDIVLLGIGAVAGSIGIALIVVSERQLRRQAERDVRRALFPVWERLRRADDRHE